MIPRCRLDIFWVTRGVILLVFLVIGGVRFHSGVTAFNKRNCKRLLRYLNYRDFWVVEYVVVAVGDSAEFYHVGELVSILFLAGL